MLNPNIECNHMNRFDDTIGVEVVKVFFFGFPAATNLCYFLWVILSRESPLMRLWDVENQSMVYLDKIYQSKKTKIKRQLTNDDFLFEITYAMIWYDIIEFWISIHYPNLNVIYTIKVWGIYIHMIFLYFPWYINMKFTRTHILSASASANKGATFLVGALWSIAWSWILGRPRVRFGKFDDPQNVVL